MIKEWTIYKILSPSNRVYIGVTSNYKIRVGYYRNNHLSGQKNLYRSFNKYGFKAHTFEVIDSFTGTVSEAYSKEMFWIRTYMSNHAKYPEMKGLNLTDGGGGTRGHKASAETRIKLSAAKKGEPAWNKGKKGLQVCWAKGTKGVCKSWNKGKKFEGTDEERKIKFGAHNIGNAYNKGRKHSNEFRETLSLLKKGKSNIALYKKVLRYNKRGELMAVYKSIKHGAEKSGYSEWTIGNICKGLRKTKSNSIFKYAS